MLTWAAIVVLSLIFLGCGCAFEWSQHLEGCFQDEEHPRRRLWLLLFQVTLGFGALAAGYGAVSLMFKQVKAGL